MSKKLYVGNLSFSVDDGSLQTLFSAVGSVASARVIRDRDTGRSKGFGFVEMSTEEEALKAIEELNGKEHVGRQLTVSLARPQEPREQGGFRGGNGGGGGRRGGPRGGGFRQDRF